MQPSVTIPLVNVGMSADGETTRLFTGFKNGPLSLTAVANVHECGAEVEGLIVTLTVQKLETKSHIAVFGGSETDRDRDIRHPLACTMSVTLADPKDTGCITLGPVKVIINNINAFKQHHIFHFIDDQVYNACSFHEVSIEFAPATPLTNPIHLLSTINAPHASDMALLPTDAKTPILLSRFMLIQGSPFFANLFNGGAWAESTQSPIPFAWHIKAVIPCILAMHSSWVPGDAIPSVGAIENWVAAETGSRSLNSYSIADWTLVRELAQMLELPAVVWATSKLLIQLQKKEFDVMSRKYLTCQSAKK